MQKKYADSEPQPCTRRETWRKQIFSDPDILPCNPRLMLSCEDHFKVRCTVWREDVKHPAQRLSCTLTGHLPSPTASNAQTQEQALLIPTPAGSHLLTEVKCWLSCYVAGERSLNFEGTEQ